MDSVTDYESQTANANRSISSREFRSRRTPVGLETLFGMTVLHCRYRPSSHSHLMEAWR